MSSWKVKNLIIKRIDSEFIQHKLSHINIRARFWLTENKINVDEGIYLSSFNKSLNSLRFKSSNFEIIGSAHSLKEITMKVNQGCKSILFSKLFLVSYDIKAPYLGIIRFNNYLKINKDLVPLGGINLKNLNSLRKINSVGFALMSAIKKKPAKIISRLF